jgi:hypothetical protein
LAQATSNLADRQNRFRQLAGDDSFAYVMDLLAFFDPALVAEVASVVALVSRRTT